MSPLAKKPEAPSSTPLDAPPSADPLADAIPFKDLHKLYPVLFPKKNTGPWLLLNRKANGLDPYVLWVGRHAFILRSSLLEWMRLRSQPAPRRRS